MPLNLRRMRPNEILTIPRPDSKAADRYNQGIGKIAAGYDHSLRSLAEVIDSDLLSTWQKGRTSLRMKFNLDERAFYLSIVAGVLDGVAALEQRSNLERIYKFVNEKKHSPFLQPSREFGDLAGAAAALQEFLRILERPEICPSLNGRSISEFCRRTSFVRELCEFRWRSSAPNLVTAATLQLRGTTSRVRCQTSSESPMRRFES